MPTYREQRDKIIEAYFKGEIQPMNSNFCFCGTLAGGMSWLWRRDKHCYSLDEFRRMEAALLFLFDDHDFEKSGIVCVHGETHPQYEEVLFEGMSNALDVLKQIHIEHGENVDEELSPFIKRDLSTRRTTIW